MAVQHGHERLQFSGAESRLESLDRLRRERYFRHEDDRAFAFFERVGDGLQINLRLAAAGDAVEQKRVGRGPGSTRVARVKFGVAPNCARRCNLRSCVTGEQWLSSWAGFRRDAGNNRPEACATSNPLRSRSEEHT